MKYYKKSIFAFLVLIFFIIMIGTSIMFMMLGKISLIIGGKMTLVSFILAFIAFQLFNEMLQMDIKDQMKAERIKNRSKRGR